MATMNDDGALAKAMVADGKKTTTKPAVRKEPTKKATTKAAKPAATPAKARAKAPALKDIVTLDDACLAFLAALVKKGKSAGTARSYGADLAVAKKHFGAELPVRELSTADVEEYFASDLVTKTRAGEPKNPITTAKIRRVFRQLVQWLAEKGVLAEVPLPAAERKESAR